MRKMGFELTLQLLVGSDASWGQPFKPNSSFIYECSWEHFTLNEHGQGIDIQSIIVSIEMVIGIGGTVIQPEV